MKITTIDQVLELAEKLNNFSYVENLEVSYTVTSIESTKDIKVLCDQENGLWFEPTEHLPFYWASVQLGKVCFTLQGKKLTPKTIFI